MKENNLNSHRGFKYGILGIGLVLTLIILTLLLSTLKSNLVSILIGLLVFVIGIISIVGSIKSIKGFKEPNTIKKIIGIVLNFGMAILFISAIVANIYDIYKVFSI